MTRSREAAPLDRGERVDLRGIDHVTDRHALVVAWASWMLPGPQITDGLEGMTVNA